MCFFYKLFFHVNEFVHLAGSFPGLFYVQLVWYVSHLCEFLHKELWLFVFLFYFFKIRPYKFSMGFFRGSAGKESTCNAGNLGSIPNLWRSPGEWKVYPLHYPGLENSGAIPWGLKESDTTEQLSLLLSNSHYRYEMVDFPLHTHTFRA